LYGNVRMVGEERLRKTFRSSWQKQERQTQEEVVLLGTRRDEGEKLSRNPCKDRREWRLKYGKMMMIITIMIPWRNSPLNAWDYKWTAGLTSICSQT
jgi:hypothetical protein